MLLSYFTACHRGHRQPFKKVLWIYSTHEHKCTKEIICLPKGFSAVVIKVYKWRRRWWWFTHKEYLHVHDGLSMSCALAAVLCINWETVPQIWHVWAICWVMQLDFALPKILWTCSCVARGNFSQTSTVIDTFQRFNKKVPQGCHVSYGVQIEKFEWLFDLRLIWLLS